VIVTQTLQLIYDVRAAVSTLHRMLRPGGVLLLTVPGVSQIDRGQWGGAWCWSFTRHAVRRLLEERFAAADVSVDARGNVLAAVAFLHGMAVSELRPSELDAVDSQYEMLIAARAVKGVP
jgi:hypothetical protein